MKTNFGERLRNAKKQEAENNIRVEEAISELIRNSKRANREIIKNRLIAFFNTINEIPIEHIGVSYKSNIVLIAHWAVKTIEKFGLLVNVNFFDLIEKIDIQRKELVGMSQREVTIELKRELKLL